MHVLGYSLLAAASLFAVYFAWQRWANQIPVLAGTVTVNGETLESFRVEVSSSDNVIKKAAGGGEFRLLDIPTGTFNLVVSLPDRNALSVEADCAMSGRFAHVDVKFSLQISALQIHDVRGGQRMLSWNPPPQPTVEASGAQVTLRTHAAMYEHRILRRPPDSDAVAELGTASSNAQSGKTEFSVQHVEHCIYVVETNLVGCKAIKATKEVPS